MKKMSFLILSFLIVTIGNASSSVTVFSNTGLRFWVIVNGEKINKTASERVVFDKKAGTYKLRVIIENQPTETIDDNENFIIDVSDNYNHLFDVGIGNDSKKTVTLKPYKFVSTKNIKGKWKLNIFDLTKIVNIKILEKGELVEDADFIISDNKTGDILLQGALDRNTNILSVKYWTIEFYRFIESKTVKIKLPLKAIISPISEEKLFFLTDQSYSSKTFNIYYTIIYQNGNSNDGKVQTSISLSK